MLSRREVFHGSLGAAAGLLPLARDHPSSTCNLKVVVAGGHPDDPESGCGGTMARFSDLGHEVVALYLTRGEGRPKGIPLEESAALRTAEALKACEILKARPRFVGQIAERTEINAVRYAELRTILEEEKPDVVLTHWPIDSHPDHRVMSLLVYDAWLRAKNKFILYYYEVITGWQTQHFRPTHYVDILATEERKRAAVLAHASQSPATDFYVTHEMMHRFRGLEFGVKSAEAFVRHVLNRGDALP